LKPTADRLIEIFTEAKALIAGPQREEFLYGACGADTPLHGKLMRLLSAHESAGEFLHAVPLERRPMMVTERAGDFIDRYMLLEKIGEGGCGVVYLAEQEKPVRRRVALKVIKAGMDTRQVIARFEGERQALAMMDHPNIARVLDAGATEAGRPFFVMELVSGARITDYSDANHLRTEERLELFVRVCDAVQHAHQKGIIHRDLKPSNILVTAADGVVMPKVIDFGIAKATEGRLSDLTALTETLQLIGTPAYMSPEQAEMGAVDIDTRTDVYSLGVLLYELLTGRTPFDASHLMTLGMNEVRRAIQETQPAKPSTRLSTLRPEDLSTTAAQRQTDSQKLLHTVRGDLDWIVIKCLEKDRSRRYQTSSALAEDVRRHLKHETVEARPPSRVYQFRKLVRRNQLAFVAAGAVAVALAAGLGLSTWLFLRERAALRVADENASRAQEQATRAEGLRQKAEANERRAISEAAKSQQVARFLEEMLKSVGPTVALGRDTVLLREILEQTAKRLGELKDQPLVEADLRSTLGNVHADLSDYSKAEEMHQQALAVRRRLLGDDHPATANSLHDLGHSQWNQGKVIEAETAMREAIAIRRKLFGEEHADVARSLYQLGGALRYQGKLQEAEAVQRDVLRIRRMLFVEEHADVAESLNQIGSLLVAQNKAADAEPFQVQALATRRKLFGAPHPSIAEALTNLASVLLFTGKLAEAETMHREGLEMQKALVGDGHSSLGFCFHGLGMALWQQGKVADAEAAFRDAVRVGGEFRTKNHPEAAAWRKGLLSFLGSQEKFREHEVICRETLIQSRNKFGNSHPEVCDALFYLAQSLTLQRKLTEAESVCREALVMARSLSGGEDGTTAEILLLLAEIHRNSAKWDEAETASRGELRIRRKMRGDEHPEVARSLTSLSTALRKQRKFAEAEASLREAQAILRKHFGEKHPHVASSLGALTRSLMEAERFADAEASVREAIDIHDQHRLDGWFMFHLRSMLGECLVRQRKFGEAEAMVIAGYEGMKSREETIPVKFKDGVRHALQRVLDFYLSTGDLQKAAEWKAKSEDQGASAAVDW
jgi:eukaryotic-like serine/threonine-protein kinase